MIDLDLNTRRMQREAFSAAITARIDAALEATSETPRDYLGASAIGDECPRRVQYERLGAPGDPIPGKLRRIFARGHAGERLAVEWLKAAGFQLKHAGPYSEPLGFKVAGGRFRGHIDGVIHAGPSEAMEYPAIWECKVLGAKGWTSLVKSGVAKAYPKYADQIALYQTYIEMPAPALLTAVNADTMELYHELVPYDAARAQEASDRAVRILQALDAGELLPRAANEPSAYPCAFCRFKNHCWA